MKYLLPILLLSLLCTAEEDFPGDSFSINFDDSLLPSVPKADNMVFHWNTFLRQAAQQPGQNTMYCPVLVETLLSALHSCATGATKTVLAPFSTPATHPNLHCGTLLAADEALPVSHTAPPMLRLPFSSNPQQAAEALNQHCSQLTQGHITHIITPEAVAGAPFLPLGTVFFQAPWRIPLQAAYTATFTNARAEQEPCTMLTGDAACLISDDYQAIARSYNTASSELIFIAILPKDSAQTFLQQLTHDNLQQIRENLFSNARHGEVFLPRLNISTPPVNLLPTLQQSELRILCTPEAFRRNAISPLPIGLTSLQSACSLSLDEQGTTASAAGAATTIILSIRPRVHFNRPFIWLICPRNPNQQPLFMGIINSLNRL